MPELPEVETLRRGLEQQVLERRITDVFVAIPKVLKGQSPQDFRDRVVGRSIQRVDRRGKYLLIRLAASTSPFSPSVFLCIHLKMRGQLLLENATAAPGKYHCITLAMDNQRVLRFYDMWTWGEMRALLEAELAQVRGLCRMGEEPLEADWDGARLAARLKRRRGPVKALLLDQSLLAGVGNIYADESLFMAKIHPERNGSTLTSEETSRLAQAIRFVLQEAVSCGGTTSDNYVDADGQAGRYTPRVYERGGAPCLFCGVALQRIRLGGRGTVFCPQCQR